MFKLRENTITSTILLIFIFVLQINVLANANIEGDINSLLEKANNILTENSQKALEISFFALNLSDSIKNEKLIGLSKKSIGVAYVEMYLYKKSIPYLKEALEVLSDLNLPREISIININLGKAYRENDAYILAEKALKDCIVSASSLGDTTLLGNAYYMLTKVYRKKSDFVAGLETCLKCLEIAKQTSDVSLQAGCENEMGNVFFNQGNIEDALRYYNYALEKKLAVNDSSGIADIQINIGNVYRSNNNNLKAIELYHKASSYMPKTKYQPNVFNIPYDLGIAYYNMNQLAQSKQFLNNAIEIAEMQNSQSDIANGKIWLAKVLTDENQYTEAKANLDDALLIAKNIASVDVEKNAYQGYYFYHKEKKEYEQALENYKKYTDIINRILSNENNRALDEMKVIYESEKQASEIKELQNQVLKQELDNTRLKNSRNRWLLITLLAVIIIITGTIIVHEKRKGTRILSKKNEELLSAIKELEESLQTKDKLFSIISHDLRNPFNSILGLSELLFKNYASITNEQVKNYGNGIYSSASKAYDLLQNLLSWSRIQIGKITVNQEYIQLSLLIEKEILNCTDIAQNKNISIVNHIDSSTCINVDASMLSITIRNLLTNAIKFSPVNSIVNVNSNLNKEHIDIIISDPGVGIPKEKIDKLFSFSENTSTPGTEGEKGTGLGLVLCYELIKLNNGNIKVASQSGKTDFTVSLPIA